MKNNPNYHLAKTGDSSAAEQLLNQTVQSTSVFQNLTGFVCPLQKPKGNSIPMVLALLMSANSKLILSNSVYLQHTAHGSSMVEILIIILLKIILCFTIKFQEIHLPLKEYCSF
jgi:hypothetical protein